MPAKLIDMKSTLPSLGKIMTGMQGKARQPQMRKLDINPGSICDLGVVMLIPLPGWTFSTKASKLLIAKEI